MCLGLELVRVSLMARQS